MKKFELFLDESGEFDEKDLDENRNPSLIGGLLVPEGVLNDEIACEICKDIDQKIHMSEEHQKIEEKIRKIQNDRYKTNEKDEEELRKLYKIKGQQSANALKILNKAINLPGASIVIFQNKERIQAENTEELYFTLMVEGIASLFDRLSLENPYEPISLDIKKAVRVNMEKKNNNFFINNANSAKEVTHRIERI